MTLYQMFKTKARLCEETEFVKIYEMTVEGTEYKVVITQKRANDHTVIHCEGNRVFWEQVPRFPQLAGRRYGDKTPIFRALPEKTCVTVFVVKGKPDGFVGLDDGAFHCADNFSDRHVNVMSYKRFKRL